MAHSACANSLTFSNNVTGPAVVPGIAGVGGVVVLLAGVPGVPAIAATIAVAGIKRLMPT